MIEGLEHVSNLIARYAIVEHLYLQTASAISSELLESIIRLYTAILSYLSKASRYYNLGTGGMLTSLYCVSDEADLSRACCEEYYTNCGCKRRCVSAQNLRRTS